MQASVSGAVAAVAGHQDPIASAFPSSCSSSASIRSSSSSSIRSHEQRFGFKSRSVWSGRITGILPVESRQRVSAVVGSEGEDQENAEEHSSNNGVLFSVEEQCPLLENVSEPTSKLNPTSGLFRSPISGGVESATSSLGLPRPALAVRNLMEQARYAHLCTVMSRMHHRRLGYPFGTLVDFASDASGHPIFSLSPLEIHTRNLLADPRCTLVVQVPGFSGLGNARATLFGDVYPLPPEKQEWAHKQYMRKHQQGASQQWGNFYYYQMRRISDILFVGGFGTVAWVDVQEFENAQPDVIAADGDEETLKALNAIFSRPLREMLSAEAETDVDEASVISIDSKGIDIRVRQGSKRLPFDGGHPVETLDEAKEALDKLIKKRTKSITPS